MVTSFNGELFIKITTDEFIFDGFTISHSNDNSIYTMLAAVSLLFDIVSDLKLKDVINEIDDIYVNNISNPNEIAPIISLYETTFKYQHLANTEYIQKVDLKINKFDSFLNYLLFRDDSESSVRREEHYNNKIVTQDLDIKINRDTNMAKVIHTSFGTSINNIDIQKYKNFIDSIVAYVKARRGEAYGS